MKFSPGDPENYARAVLSQKVFADAKALIEKTLPGVTFERVDTVSEYGPLIDRHRVCIRIYATSEYPLSTHIMK